MKKLCVLLVALLSLSFTAIAEEWNCPSCGNAASGNFCSNCGSAKSAVTEEGAIEDTSSIEEVDSKEEGFAVTKEYFWNTMWGNYCALVVQNTSGSKCGYEIRIVFQDQDGNAVGIANREITVCDPGYEVLVTATSDIAFERIEYDITPTKASYNDVHSYVNVTAQKVGSKAILSAVNTGTVDAEFVEYHCLFLNSEEEVVGTGWGYLVDNDSELKSGKTELREETCSEDFSSVVVFFEGRTNRSVVNSGTVEVDQLTSQNSNEYEVTHEYRWDSYWNHNYALVIKNTSGKTCGFTAQIIFYNESDEIVGVANPMITVIGDGYEALLKTSQDTAFDHATYSITSISSRYEDVHSFVDISTSIAGRKAILAAKNNGTKVAQFVEYHCLFLDSDGNVVGSDWGYLVDSDSAIKPGKTEMREAETYESFDSVVVFFEGRCNK